MISPKAVIAVFTATAALVMAVSAAPAQVTKAVASRAESQVMDSDEQVVADFLVRKDRAEKAQRSIIARLRKELDRKRLEFEEARRRFDDARSRYVDITGPLPKQGVMNPTDPRIPYEFEMRRGWTEASETKPGYLPKVAVGAPPK